jgi:hypothetical protein
LLGRNAFDLVLRPDQRHLGIRSSGLERLRRDLRADPARVAEGDCNSRSGDLLRRSSP